MMHDLGKGVMGGTIHNHTILDVGSTLDLFAGGTHLIRDYISAKRFGGDKGWCARYADLFAPEMCKSYFRSRGEDPPSGPSSDGWVVPFKRTPRALPDESAEK